MVKNIKSRNLISRLNRIAGQINGVKIMIESNRDCLDVIIQMSAIRAALGKLETMIVQDHMGKSICQSIKLKDQKALSDSFNKLMKHMLK